MSKATSPDKAASRRAILLRGATIAGGLAAATSLARAQTKLSHKEAKYQDTPKNGQKCSTCIQFAEPASCKIVVDPISPDGWCQFYGAKTG
jgi:hypothetical protein